MGATIKPLFKKQGRFSVSKKGYRMDRRLYLIWAFLMFLYVGGAFLWLNQHGGFFISCPECTERACSNPYFHNCDDMLKVTKGKYAHLCEQEFLLPGEEYGVRAPWWLENMVYFSVFGILAAIVINHQLHNRGRDEI